MQEEFISVKVSDLKEKTTWFNPARNDDFDIEIDEYGVDAFVTGNLTNAATRLILCNVSFTFISS